MTLDEFMTRLREKTFLTDLNSEDGMTDAEMKQVINDSIQALCKVLISRGDQSFIKSVLATYGMDKPSDWYRPCGIYPIKEQGGKLYPQKTMSVRYYSLPSAITNGAADIPLDYTHISVLLEVATLVIMVRNDQDISQRLNAAGNILKEAVQLVI